MWGEFYEYGKARSGLFLQDDLVEESKRIVTFVNSSEFVKYLQASPSQKNQVSICSIPKAPVQEVTSLKVAPVNKVMEVSIASPPIQQVISLQVGSPFKASEIRIPMPPVQKVTSLRVATPC